MPYQYIAILVDILQPPINDQIKLKPIMTFELSLFVFFFEWEEKLSQELNYNVPICIDRGQLSVMILYFT